MMQMSQSINYATHCKSVKLSSALEVFFPLTRDGWYNAAMGKQFSRTKRKSEPKTIVITDRDVAVFEALLEFTVLSTDQLHSLVGGGRVGFSKRMRVLYDAGYVARPSVQNELFRYGDKRPMIHTLGQKGADYLRIVCGKKVPINTDWERNARERKNLRGQFLLLHNLGANGATIALRTALEGLDGITVHSPTQIVEQSPEWTQKANKPFSIPTRFVWVDGQQHERNIVPDGVIGYEDHRLDKSIKALLFIEFDQEMDVNRTDPRQSSIRQKIACYSAMFLDKTVKARYGYDAFRVLFVTTGSQKHLGTMLDCCKTYRSTVGRKIPPYPFFFATRDEFEASENPLGDFWRDGDGSPKAITRLDS